MKNAFGAVALAVILASIAGCDAPGLSHTTTTAASYDSVGDGQPSAEWIRDVAKGRTKGRIDPADVQRTVRASFPTFKACYDKALRADPHAHGTVQVFFVIEEDGTVWNVADERSTMDDPKMVRCVVDGFRKLRFPRPAGGIVAVRYPIVFRQHG